MFLYPFFIKYLLVPGLHDVTMAFIIVGCIWQGNEVLTLLMSPINITSH